MKNFSGLNVLVIGLARSGAAACRLLDRLGAATAVTDLKTADEMAGYVSRLPQRTKRLLGGHGGVAPENYDLAVISPGAPLDAALPIALRSAGVEIVSEVELAYSLLDAPLIAVTGTNGKSTTTSLIGGILEAAGKSVFVGGNIGAPLAGAVGGTYDWIVAEISTFQLETVKTFRPRVGLILNITPDHLDRHKDMETYTALKARLFENQRPGDTLILNADDPRVMDLKPNPETSVYRFSLRPLARGAWVENGRAMARLDDEPLELFAIEELKIKGQHNVENALAASLAGLAAGAAPEAVREGVLGFTGLPHRMEMVDEIEGITYYNDSKATNVEAVVKSLAYFNKNVALIAGGSSKGLDFSLMAGAVRERVKGVALIGETAAEIERALGDYQPKAPAADMDEAVRLATGWCGLGDAVLLSPGCASFDMYQNYEDRGEAFRAAVADVKKGALP